VTPAPGSTDESDVVVAWVAGRAAVSEADFHAALLQQRHGHNEARGSALARHNDGAAPVSSTTSTRSLAGSALVDPARAGRAVLSAPQQQELGRVLDRIQQHFQRALGAQADRGFAMDVEFIVDDDRIRVLQARPFVD
jgi:hypothetical protein